MSARTLDMHSTSNLVHPIQARTNQCRPRVASQGNFDTYCILHHHDAPCGGLVLCTVAARLVVTKSSASAPLPDYVLSRVPHRVSCWCILPDSCVGPPQPMWRNRCGQNVAKNIRPQVRAQAAYRLLLQHHYILSSRVARVSQRY